MEPKITFKKLIEAHQKYLAAIGRMERELEGKVEFQYFVIHQQSDGFVLVHSEYNMNARLKDCLEIIQRKGTLSYEDYEAVAI